MGRGAVCSLVKFASAGLNIVLMRRGGHRGDFERFCHEIQAEARRRLLQSLLRNVRDVYKPAADVGMMAGDFIHQAVKEMIAYKRPRRVGYSRGNAFLFDFLNDPFDRKAGPNRPRDRLEKCFPRQAGFLRYPVCAPH